jgi:hypothetical protein
MKVTITENMEELFIDRVVESLLADTTYQVYHRFMGDIVCKIECPMFVTDLGYNQYQIEGYLNELKESNRYNWDIPLGDYKYLDINYGITDETIIRKIYFKYHIILFTEIINAFNNYQWNPINESVNKYDPLVDMIVNDLIEETKYNFRDIDNEVIVYITFPGDPQNYDRYNMNNLTSSNILWYNDQDMEYINTQFGISDLTTINYIWEKYYILLYTKIKDEYNKIWKNRNKYNTLNESVNRQDQLIEYISNNLYMDTKYRFMYNYDDEVTVIITWPTESGEQDYSIWDMEEWDVFYYSGEDAQFLDKHYGITDEDLIEKIFNTYIQKLAPVIYKKMEYLDNNREEP